MVRISKIPLLIKSGSTTFLYLEHFSCLILVLHLVNFSTSLSILLFQNYSSPVLQSHIYSTSSYLYKHLFFIVSTWGNYDYSKDEYANRLFFLLQCLFKTLQWFLERRYTFFLVNAMNSLVKGVWINMCFAEKL